MAAATMGRAHAAMRSFGASLTLAPASVGRTAVLPLTDGRTGVGTGPRSRASATDGGVGGDAGK